MIAPSLKYTGRLSLMLNERPLVAIGVTPRHEAGFCMQVGRAQRQGSRLGIMHSSSMQPVNTGHAQANGSSLEQCSPSQPRSPASTAPQVISSPRPFESMLIASEHLLVE